MLSNLVVVRQHRTTVREQDLNLEISILRGLTSPSFELASNCEATSATPGNNSSLNNQGRDNDSELEIIDTRMINQIDLSKAALHISQIKDKKSILLDIEQKIEDASSVFLSPIELGTSTLELKRFTSGGSSRVERTLDHVTPKCSRDGGARITPPKFIYNMDSIQDHEKNLLPQEALGSSRDRHSDEPDAAGSTVVVRESCKDTVGMVSASVPTDQAATAEFDLIEVVSCVMENAPDPVQAETTALIAGEKRKASTSLGSDADGVVYASARRPTKTRVESMESPKAASMKHDSEVETGSVFEIKSDMEFKGKTNVSSTEHRATRSAVRRKLADFNQLTASRFKKGVNSKNELVQVSKKKRSKAGCSNFLAKSH